MMPRKAFTRRRGAPALAFITAAAVALTLGGCSAQDPNASVDKTRIVVAYTNETTTIDPARADYVQTNNVAQTLYDALVTYDEDQQLIGSLATEYAYNDDVDAIRVTLREDVTFHDGATLTSADVQWSLDRYKRLGVGIYGMIPTYDSTEIVSDTELVIHLTERDPLFLGALSRIFIVNSALAEENAGSDDAQSWLLNHDAGSGAFTLGDVSSGTYTLERYDDYWDFDDTRPEELVLRRIDDLTTTKQELLAGNIDVGQIAPSEIGEVEQAGYGIETWSSPMTYVYFNTSHGATADPAVREALIHAYNYQEALDRFRGGAGTLADGPLSTTLPCRPDLPEVSYDPEGAKKILEEAGITDLSLTMRYQSAFAEQTQEATLFQSNLQDIGVDMQLEPIAFADYLTSLQSPETTPEVFLATDSPPFPDAGVVLTQSFASDAVGTNRAAYSNPEVDALLEQASGEPDADARCAVYEEVQEIIAGDFAVMPLYNVDMPVAHSDGVTDVDAWAPNANPAFQEYRVAP